MIPVDLFDSIFNSLSGYSLELLRDYLHKETMIKRLRKEIKRQLSTEKNIIKEDSLEGDFSFSDLSEYLMNYMVLEDTINSLLSEDKDCRKAIYTSIVDLSIQKSSPENDLARNSVKHIAFACIQRFYSFFEKELLSDNKSLQVTTEIYEAQSTEEEWFLAFEKSSEATKQRIETANNKVMLQAFNILSSTILPFSLVSINDAIKSLTKNLLYEYLNTKEIKELSKQTLTNMADLQSLTAVSAALYKTTMIDSVAKSIASLNMQGYISAVQEAVNKSDINMADYSFMRTYPLMENIKEDLNLPYGFKTDIKAFNHSSALKISSNKQIIFNTHERAFISGNYKSSTSEINTICSALLLFDEIGDIEVFSEEELMGFMSFLDKTPKLGISNPTGEKIYRLIESIKDLSGFDHNEYYHSRPREREKAPYIWEQMLKAPYGVSSAGRFNEIGQARFYFSDAEIGAVNEIRKHIDKSKADDYVIQTMMVSAQNPIKILDISAKNMRNLNTFLKYLRFPLSSDSGKRPREYLLPQFVGECCEACKIDGIKYYGGKDYSNYVTWSDKYFGFIRNLGDSESK